MTNAPTIYCDHLQNFKRECNACASFCDDTRDANNATTCDAAVFPATPVACDAAYFGKCERILEVKQKELGLEGYFIFHRATRGEIEGWFTSPRTTDLTPREVTQRVKQALPKMAGLKFYTGAESEVSEDKGKNVFVLSLRGDDHESLEDVALALEEYLIELPGPLPRIYCSLNGT